MDIAKTVQIILVKLFIVTECSAAFVWDSRSFTDMFVEHAQQ